MEEKDKNKRRSKKKQGDGFFKMLISGSLFSERLILGNLGLLSLLTLLGALYIANRFHAEKIIRTSRYAAKGG